MAALPPYRLQTLLEVRERKKEAAEQHLGTCMVALRREQDKLTAMNLELTRMVAKRETRRREFLEKAMQGDVSALDAINNNKYLERLKELETMQKEAIEGQKSVVAQRQDDVERARQELIVANQELKALEKHKEKWADEVKKARASREEDTMDELAQTVFTRGIGAGHKPGGQHGDGN
jgi:flagellar export protein FliJ